MAISVTNITTATDAATVKGDSLDVNWNRGMEKREVITGVVAAIVGSDEPTTHVQVVSAIQHNNNNRFVSWTYTAMCLSFKIAPFLCSKLEIRTEWRNQCNELYTIDTGIDRT